MVNHQETWRPVKGQVAGWPYEVSDCGRVRTVNPRSTLPLGSTLKARINRAGYERVRLSADNSQIERYVHVLVLEAFGEERPDRLIANHIDGNKRNNAFANLEWVTQSENQKHAVAMGLKGPGRPRLLSNEQACQIRQRHAGGESPNDLARSYGVHQGTIVAIVQNRTYRNAG